LKIKELLNNKILDILSSLSGFNIRDKAGTYIGARMGRPEKAKLRKLTGSPHVLFPVGEEGGRLRSLQSALDVGTVKSDFPLYYCEKCNEERIYPKCSVCSETCKKMNYCYLCDKNVTGKCEEHNIGLAYKNRRIDVRELFNHARKTSGVTIEEAPLVKGVRGTSSTDHSCENLAKGLLRAKHKLHVNKDGTIRYDVTEMPLTHFKPKEIGASVEKVRELGYEKDYQGNKIVDEDQLIELLPQDVILPACPETQDEKADDVFVSICNFMDDLLVRFYGMETYYNVKTREDLIGHLVLGLAPHTSAGIVGRIIGFSKTIGCLAHPMWHAAMRRDCEGDETCVLLLLDALLNFSQKYLPAHRGSTQDAPLVVSSKLDAPEIDDMAFDIDVVWRYPLELYEAAAELKDPWTIKIEQLKDRLGTDAAYSNFGFTHTVDDLNNSVLYSAYKKLPTMDEKVSGQMQIAKDLGSVITEDVARLIIERHFIRDIRGNLRKFSMQGFRCVGCNGKYRRPPLAGKCTKCGGKIIFTIAEGSIMKYMNPALDLARTYNASKYLLESLELTEMYIQSIFGKEKEKQEALGKWF